jgi:sugar lactone lactonase YvrE
MIKTKAKMQSPTMNNFQSFNKFHPKQSTFSYLIGGATILIAMTATDSSFSAASAAVLYEADAGTGKIQKFDTTTGALVPGFNVSLSNPSGLAVDASGNLYASNYVTNIINKYSSAGTLLSTITLPGLQPVPIAIDLAGNLYEGNISNNTIQKYSSAGVLISGSTIATGSPSGAVVSNPTGLAVDSTGNLYVGNYNNNTIQKFNATGSLLSTLSISLPSGLAVDSSDNL